jgi:hypothetical protein
MFRYLAKKFVPPTGPPEAKAKVFLVHPLQLSRWLEVAWAAAPNVPILGPDPNQTSDAQQLGSPTVILDFDLPELLLRELEPGVDLADPGTWTNTPQNRHTTPLLWDHLIYAYLIESTGVYEIIARILGRIVRGETLGRLQPATLQWARATEELLLRDPPLFSIGGIESRARPDIRIQRRNAHWRMFGLDLPHPLPASAAAGDAPAPWKLDIGNGANTAFVSRWNELLTQVWTGYENKNNESGANATDAQYVGMLCEAIDDMLGNRRQGGLLAREEFSHVAAMSWCHLTVEVDTPLVQDLQATATSPAERLAKLGERVGMAPAPRSRELFELAEPMSSLLWAIELGFFNQKGSPEALYLPNVPNGPPTKLNLEVNRIIDLWQSATGTRIKAPTATAAAAPAGAPATRLPAQPLRVPSPGPAAGPAPVGAAAGRSTNGSRS